MARGTAGLDVLLPGDHISHRNWNIYRFTGGLLDCVYKFLLVFSHENKFFATRDFASESFGERVFFLLKPRAALASRCAIAAVLLSP